MSAVCSPWHVSSESACARRAHHNRLLFHVVVVVVVVVVRRFWKVYDARGGAYVIWPVFCVLCGL
jgi:hypothetical protein